MADRLSIFADVPSHDPKLGFERYSAALADAIRGGQPAQFAVGIYGPWGSGKSSLLNAIGRRLERDPTVLPVFFDAWRYERTDHIIIPLLHRIERAIGDGAGPAVADKIRRALVSVIKSVSLSFGPVTIDPGKVIEGFGADEATLRAAADDAYSRPYQDMKEISKALDERRIVVLIDDLDRCSSEKVVAVLEAINLVMDVPGFIFVLALDYDMLVRAVSMRYPHASGHVFIEKMVQVPVRVPRLEVMPESFLSDLIPGWEAVSEQLPADFTAAVYDVAEVGLHFNPRQIKRLINSMLVLLRVAEGTAHLTESRLLAGVVGLQLRWPDEYRDLADAVYSGDESPTANLIDAESDDLRRYAGRFFGQKLTREDLLPVLALTRVVVNPAAMHTLEDDIATEDRDTDIAHTRAENRAMLLASMEVNGYVQPQPNAMVFNKLSLPGLRIKFGQNVVRFEFRDRTRWRLLASCPLSSGYEQAVDIVRNDDHFRQLAGQAPESLEG